MSPQEIVDRLKRYGVDPNDVFNANGDLLENDKYHLVSSEGVWQVYYSERGHKWDYREFNSESDACEYLWNLLEKDETIWR
ncbi:MAG: hypothetical protein ACREXS_21750 [Gammaproteobacteria bacterium]